MILSRRSLVDAAYAATEMTWCSGAILQRSDSAQMDSDEDERKSHRVFPARSFYPVPRPTKRPRLYFADCDMAKMFVSQCRG